MLLNAFLDLKMLRERLRFSRCYNRILLKSRIDTLFHVVEILPLLSYELDFQGTSLNSPSLSHVTGVVNFYFLFHVLRSILDPTIGARGLLYCSTEKLQNLMDFLVSHEPKFLTSSSTSRFRTPNRLNTPSRQSTIDPPTRLLIPYTCEKFSRRNSASVHFCSGRLEIRRSTDRPRRIC